jgi:hypothetical protein
LGAVFINDREGVENNTEIYFSIIGGLPETGFLRDISLQPADSGKNPVSLVRGWPETEFF